LKIVIVESNLSILPLKWISNLRIIQSEAKNANSHQDR